MSPGVVLDYYRLMIQEVTGAEVVISYTRWLESVIVKGTENQEVYVTFSPQFERILMETKKRLPEYVSENRPISNSGANIRFVFFDWATKYVGEGSQTISLEELRRVFGLESIKDPEGNVIREAPLPVWGRSTLPFWRSTRKPV